jgi:hypothetical protein
MVFLREWSYLGCVVLSRPAVQESIWLVGVVEDELVVGASVLRLQIARIAASQSGNTVGDGAQEASVKTGVLRWEVWRATACLNIVCEDGHCHGSERKEE